VGADLLILGSFGKSVFKQIYPPSRLSGKWRRIAQVGFYDIYVSRKQEKKLLKMLTSPVVPAKLDALAPRNYTTLNAQPLTNPYNH
jgi:hypothetical protein